MTKKNMKNLNTFKLDEITTGIPGGFFIYRNNEEQNILYVNNEILRLYECNDIEEFMNYVNGSFLNMVYEEDLNSTLYQINDQIKTSFERLDYVEYRIKTKKGRIKYVEDFGHLVYNEVYGDVFYVFVSDKTEKIEAELKNKLKYRNIIEDKRLLQKALGSTIQTYKEMYYINVEDDYYRMIYPTMHNIKKEGKYTDAVKSIFTNKELYEKPDYEMMEYLSPQNIKKLLKEKNSIECKYRKFGEKGIAEWYFFTITVLDRIDKEVSGVILFNKSIDEMIKQEEVQKKYLVESKNKAEQINKEKTYFFSSMNHDMRTPMNAIINFTELALKENNNPKTQEYLKKISKASNFLLSLINDILNMSQIEAGGVTFEEKSFDLSLLINDLLSSIESIALSKNITINKSFNFINKIIKSDSIKLSQVLLNILGNSLKYSSFGGNINFVIDEIPKNNESEYIFIINDNGVGIPKDKLDIIFDPYVRIDNSMQGNGLGLSIAKKIIEKLGGRISINSDCHGTTFTINIVFPWGVENKKSIITDDIDDCFDDLCVLIVDDIDINREVVVELLKMWNVKCDVASSGLEAIDKISKNEYDGVYMDISMPEMDGYETTKIIRKTNPKLPIFAMTANVFSEDINKALINKMNGHISKPIDLDKLKKSLYYFKIEKSKNKSN